MINFFRKTRKKMADDNRFFKYWRYAIGEIVLVVVGILIALQINTWNEERKGRMTSINYLERLLDDIKKDTATLNGKIRSSNELIPHYKDHSREMYNKQKSTKEFIEFTSSFQMAISNLVLSNLTYAELANTGTFQLIDNQELRNQIAIYYNYCESIKLELAGHNKTIGNIIINAASKSPLMKYKTKAQDSTLLGDVDRAFDKKDWEFINDPRSIEFRIYEEVVIWHYLIHQGFIPAYYGLIVLSEELILAIENELLYLKQ